jgi:hypothetical protein
MSITVADLKKEVAIANKKAYNNEQRRRFAWAKFYEVINREHEDDVETLEILVETVPEHIKGELKELYEKLKKKVECPICLETIHELDLSSCGHKYCKGCLATLKAMPEPKCAICRKKLY